VLIAFVCIYIFFFASSWGPVAWVVTGELFPLKARAKCLSITTATNWLLNWAIAYATPYMVNSGPGNANLQSKVFFIWGGFCFIAGIFVYTCIYETKGLTLEQVDELYSKIPVAWRSKDFVPSVHYTDVRDVAQGHGKANLAESLGVCHFGLWDLLRSFLFFFFSVGFESAVPLASGCFAILLWLTRDVV
jgi:hypothetical protein